MKTAPLFLLTSFLLLTVAPVRTYAEGGTGTHGGDSTAAAFYATGKRITRALEEECSEGFDPASESDVCVDALGSLKKFQDRVKVYSKPRVYAFDGNERDAVNDGVARITVGRIRWRSMNEDHYTPGNRVRLVAHEYLSIAKREVSDEYFLSEDILAFLERKNRDIFKISGIDRDAAGGIGDLIASILRSRELEDFLATTLVPPRFHFGDGGYQFRAIRVSESNSGQEWTWSDHPEEIGLKRVNPKSKMPYEVQYFELEYFQPSTQEVVKINVRSVRTALKARIFIKLD